ncbi:MAG: hypothetical protein ACFE0J_23450 [Elainellaceae cyanobacterium]
MSSQGKKRLNACLAIASYAAGGGAASVAPTPCMEVPKQIVLTASDVMMYASIWKIYFEEDLTQKDILSMLAEVGIVSVAAFGTAYLVARGSTALLHEITDWIGPIGWGMSALISGSLGGLSGMAWAFYCDRLYEQRHLDLQHKKIRVKPT